MRTRPFGRSGAALPIVGQGTWEMERDDRAEAIRAIRRGLDLGMTHIDTAEMYGSGEVEELLGEALRGRRREVFLVSKVLPQHATRRGTLEACEASLRRLKTDHLDCYLLHWPGSHPLEDTLAAFDELEAAGKIRSYGVSNFDTEELDRAVRLAGPGKIACNQVLYHLEQRTIEAALVPACAALGVTIVAYSPFGSGHFPQPRTKGGKLLVEIARSRGVSAHAVALAFLVREPSVIAIPKSSDVDHVQENAAAGDLELTADELARLDQAFPRGRWRGLPTL